MLLERETHTEHNYGVGEKKSTTLNSQPVNICCTCGLPCRWRSRCSGSSKGHATPCTPRCRASTTRWAPCRAGRSCCRPWASGLNPPPLGSRPPSSSPSPTLPTVWRRPPPVCRPCWVRVCVSVCLSVCACVSVPVCVLRGVYVGVVWVFCACVWVDRCACPCVWAGGVSVLVWEGGGV